MRAVVLPPRAYRAEARAIRTLVGETDAQIVHSHGYRTDVIAKLSLGSFNAAIVSTAHGFTGGGWRNQLYERLQVEAWKRWMKPDRRKVWLRNQQKRNRRRSLLLRKPQNFPIWINGNWTHCRGA